MCTTWVYMLHHEGCVVASLHPTTCAPNYKTMFYRAPAYVHENGQSRFVNIIVYIEIIYHLMIHVILM
jgi:hypothetical protein